MTALFAWLVAVVVAGLAWLAPSLARGVRRVRSERFRASLSKVMQLPRWYVLPAAVVGCAAEDALGRAARFVVVESRSGAAWLAAGLAAIIELALHGTPRSAWSTASALLAAGVAAAFMGWHARLGARSVP